MRWLATFKMAHATQQIGFQEYPHAIAESDARIARLEPDAVVAGAAGHARGSIDRGGHAGVSGPPSPMS